MFLFSLPCTLADTECTTTVYELIKSLLSTPALVENYCFVFSIILPLQSGIAIPPHNSKAVELKRRLKTLQSKSFCPEKILKRILMRLSGKSL